METEANASEASKRQKRSQQQPDTAAPLTSEPEHQDTEEEPQPPEGWDRCCFYLPRKRRFCRQQLLPEGRYCGNHAHLNLKNGNSQNSIAETVPPKKKTRKEQDRRQQRGRRIPCPIDPSHQIYETDVDKHVLICPSVRKEREETSQPYFMRDVNRGGYACNMSCRCCVRREDDVCGPASVAGNPRNKGEGDREQWALRWARRFLQAYLEAFPPVTSPSSSSTPSGSDPLLLTPEELYRRIPESDDSDLSSSSSFAKEIEEHRIKVGGPKHWAQIESLVRHILTSQHDSARTGKAPTILEMGAGRGMTGLMVAGRLASVCNSSDGSSQQQERVPLIMLERAGSRSKADTVLRRAVAASSSSSSSWDSNENKETDSSQSTTSSGAQRLLRFDLLDLTRIKCDVAHVHVPSVLGTVRNGNSSYGNNKNNNSNDKKEDTYATPVLVVAKHLCGVGTDLALASLLPMVQSSFLKSGGGVYMATCCHGVCDWSDYVGRPYLLELLSDEFGEDEFYLLKRWSAGTASGSAIRTSKDSDRKEQNGSAQAGDAKADNANKVDNNDDDDDDNHGPAPEESCGTSDVCTITHVISRLGGSCDVVSLGRVCQRLIDYGRREYMRRELQLEEDCRLCHYVADSVTPQNALLMGRWRRHAETAT